MLASERPYARSAMVRTPASRMAVRISVCLLASSAETWAEKSSTSTLKNLADCQQPGMAGLAPLPGPQLGQVGGRDDRLARLPVDRVGDLAKRVGAAPGRVDGREEVIQPLGQHIIQAADASHVSPSVRSGALRSPKGSTSLRCSQLWPRFTIIALL